MAPFAFAANHVDVVEVGVVRMSRWLDSQIRFALSRKSVRGNRESDKQVTDETTAGKVFSPIQTRFMWQRNEAFLCHRR
jgi:hypothetical protein